MMHGEKQILLAEACTAVPGGATPTTLWRWCIHGVRGVRLDHIRVGKRLATSREALDRFFARLADVYKSALESKVQHAPPAIAASGRSDDQRQRAVDRAERELAAMGV